jgi:hypothetical protein
MSRKLTGNLSNLGEFEIYMSKFDLEKDLGRFYERICLDVNNRYVHLVIYMLISRFLLFKLPKSDRSHLEAKKRIFYCGSWIIEEIMCNV